MGVLKTLRNEFLTPLCMKFLIPLFLDFGPSTTNAAVFGETGVYSSEKHLAEDKISLEIAKQIVDCVTTKMLPANGLPEWLRFVCQEWYATAEEEDKIRKVSEEIFLRAVLATVPTILFQTLKISMRSLEGMRIMKVIQILQKATALRTTTEEA